MEKEKGILMGFGYVFFIGVGFYLISKGAKFVPATVVIGVLLALLYLYILPTFSKKYYIYMDAADGVNFTRFLPIYNQVMLFTPTIAKVYLISTVGIIISIGCTFINPKQIAFMPPNIIMGWANGWIVISMLLLIVYSIVQGLGFTEVNKEINRGIKSISGIDHDRGIDKIFVAIQYFLLFIPIFRALSILFQIDRLNKLVLFNKVTTNELDYLAQGGYTSDGKYEDEEDEYEKYSDD